MISQPIIMEEALGKLVWGLIPERTTKSFTSQDKWFFRILGMATKEGLHSDVSSLTFKVLTWYEFDSFKKLPNGGFVAVYIPRFCITLIEDKLKKNWQERQGRYYDDLMEITGNFVVEKDIQDIEIASLNTINPAGDLDEKGKFWRFKK